MSAKTLQDDCRTRVTALERLHALHDTDMLSFRKIASRGHFGTCPAGTLSDIYHTGNVPDKWRAVFGLPLMALAPVCHCGEVHTVKTCPHDRKPRKVWVRVAGHGEGVRV